MMNTVVKKANGAKSIFYDYADYNAWANEILIDWLKTKAVEMMDVDVLSSFNTIKKTVLHIWKTQVFWLEVLNEQRDLTGEEEGVEGGVNEVCEGLVRHSRTFARFTRSLEFRDFEKEVIVNTPWFRSEQPRYELFMHAMNHSTYHRGQIITMGHQLGWKDAPMTDFNFYLLMVKK